MGICTDQSTTYLKRLGYNVVRHPQEGIQPLDLIGAQAGSNNYLGSLDRLITNAQPELPAIQSGLVATDVNGQRSSELKLAIGANILGSVIAAMGGNLGVDTSYTNARTLEFHFSDVLKDRAAPLDIGNYLRDGEVDAGNPVLKEYVLGNGRLYLITEAIKTRKLSVNYQRDTGVSAKVDVPVIQQLVGGNVAVQVAGDSSSTVTYEGQKYLTFGFRCYEVGIEGGELRLMATGPGAVPLSATGATPEAELAQSAAILTPEDVGLLQLRIDSLQANRGKGPA
jgi:hypothetical protein